MLGPGPLSQICHVTTIALSGQTSNEHLSRVYNQEHEPERKCHEEEDRRRREGEERKEKRKK